MSSRDAPYGDTKYHLDSAVTTERKGYLAHTSSTGGDHLLRVHLLAVAERAETFARRCTLPEGLGRTAGLFHDIGKYSDAFQEMLKKSAGGGHKERIEHAAHGAALLVDRGAVEAAFAIAGHHAGLHAFADLKALKTRDEWNAGERRKVIDRARECAERAASDGLALGAVEPTPLGGDPLAIEFRTRLLFSCLIDADRLDTAAFRGEARSDPPPLHPLERLKRLRAYVDGLRSGAATEVQKVRDEVLTAALGRADGAPGLYSMTVPTGGGKTLAGLAFALRHAARNGQDRVIIVVPYLSIIEQNADRIREAVGADAVLEHHSGVADAADDEAADEPAVARRLATENWDAPIVVTTSVRFFEALFTNRPGDARRVHRIARSVVVLDEVQTLPPRLLAPILDAVGRLARDHGTTFLFMTATQPAFERRPDPKFVDASGDLRFPAGTILETAPDPPSLFNRLRRVRYKWPAPGETVTWEEVARRMAEAQAALAVVNTKGQALALHRALLAAAPDSAIHLSKRMCPAHIVERLDEIRQRLANGKVCRVVSTQLVEAGVDLDFPLVLRAMGPLDSIAQVAGRCNREGRLPVGEVVVFRPERPSLPPGVYRRATEVTETLLAASGGSLDLDDPEIFRRYFREVYATGDLDARRIQESRRAWDFPTVAEAFRMIDETTRPVLVQFDKASCELAKVIRSTGRVTREILRRAQRYIVGLTDCEFGRALALGLVEAVEGCGIAIAVEDRYHRAEGLVIEETDPRALDV